MHENVGGAPEPGFLPIDADGRHAGSFAMQGGRGYSAAFGMRLFFIMLTATFLKIVTRSVVFGLAAEMQPLVVPTGSMEKNLSGVDAISRMASQAVRSYLVEVVGGFAVTVTLTVVSV